MAPQYHPVGPHGGGRTAEDAPEGPVHVALVAETRILGDRVELPAIWVIFALLAGGAAFGLLGVMLAVPVAATIGVLCRFWLRRYLASPLYLDPASD